ncbi:MAG: hypothetical protein Kow00106_03300 [Anaerolineae bacterium]
MRPHRFFIPTLALLGLVLVLTGGLWLLTPAPAAAQCGSQASSCKNCHEVNQKYPVNTSGDWHIAHAFGDFCQFCHGGNVQATDAGLAHADMFYPLQDPAQSCAACHPADFTQKAQVYADALGVTLTSGSAGGDAGDNQAAISAAATAIYAPPPLGAEGEAVLLLDYNRRYERDVLGKQDPPDWKNGLLAVMAVFLGGALTVSVWRFEGLSRTIRELRESPFLFGDPDAPPPVAPAEIPGLDRPVDERDLRDL